MNTPTPLNPHPNPHGPMVYPAFSLGQVMEVVAENPEWTAEEVGQYFGKSARYISNKLTASGMSLNGIRGYQPRYRPFKGPSVADIVDTIREFPGMSTHDYAELLEMSASTLRDRLRRSPYKNVSTVKLHYMNNDPADEDDA